VSGNADRRGRGGGPEVNFQVNYLPANKLVVNLRGASPAAGNHLLFTGGEVEPK